MPSTPKLILSPAELGHSRATFNAHFRLLGIDPVEHQRREVPCDALLDKVADINKGEIPVAAIEFHYGLVDTSFVVVLEFLGLDTTTMDYAHIPRGTAGEWETYIVDELSRTLKAINKVDMNAFSNAYFAKVQVRRTATGTFGPLVTGDPEGISFPYDTEIKDLIEQNGADKDAPRSALVVECISMEIEEDHKGTEYRHCLGMFITRNQNVAGAYVAIDRLNSSPNTLPFENRGADLGNLHPPKRP